MSKIAVVRAVKIAGGQSQLADLIGVRQGTVWKWLNRAKKQVPPAEYILAIEQHTGIPRHELRPDLYSEAA